jgi:hypothetical protein
MAVGAVDEVCDDPSEDGVAEEFEPFVGGVPGELGAPGAVGQSLAQQRRVREPVAEAGGQELQVWLAGQG